MDELDFVLRVIDPWIDRYLGQGADCLSEREVVGVGVWMLEAEVNNGGFHQYYLNSRGILAGKTVNALRLIGANATAAMLEVANGAFESFPLPNSHQERLNVVDEAADVAQFSALDALYYQQTEDRISLLARHLRQTGNA